MGTSVARQFGKDGGVTFTGEFLQAVNDWQRGGDHHQKIARGTRLKGLCAGIDARYRQCGLVVYRRVGLKKGPIWKLLADRNLPEAISAWTLSPAVARGFKGGVPRQDWQGVIFALKPSDGRIIVNLNALYQSDEFKAALEREKNSIDGYAYGAGRYAGSQCEVVLEIDSLDSADIHALGGYSSDRDTLIRMMFNQEPTPALIAWFEQYSGKAGVLPGGPMWLEGEPLQRVMGRVQPRIEPLKQIWAAQMAAETDEQ